MSIPASPNKLIADVGKVAQEAVHISVGLTVLGVQQVAQHSPTVNKLVQAAISKLFAKD
jgi:hypothetical protein